jgi:ribokinase
MENRDIDLLGIGNPCADVVLRCERLPIWDDKCAGSAVGTYAGGVESNAACAASRLGWRTAVLGEVGDDAHANFLLDAFTIDAVSTQWIRRRVGAASASTMLMLSPEGERAMVWVPMASGVTDPHLEAALACTHLAYTMPYDANALAQLYEATRRAGALLAIDIEREAARKPGNLNSFLRHCDIAFLNESGYSAALGKAPDEPELRGLLNEANAKVIVVTLGGRGACAVDQSGFFEMPAVPVSLVDATGAGDSFNAAFLFAWRRSSSLREALRFACAAASFTVTAIGARSGMPTLEQVEAALK